MIRARRLGRIRGDRVAGAEHSPVSSEQIRGMEGAFMLPDGMAREKLELEIKSRSWFHTFDFRDGIVTPGADPTPTKLQALDLPDLTGKSVIDVGAYDGFFSFEAERRGASRVVACDHFVWSWPGNDSRRNIEFVRDLLDSKIELLDMPVEELSPETAGMFDVVFFMGVLYHAPDPMLYLKRVHSITKGLLILETMVDLLDVKQPAAAFYDSDNLNHDATNHWGPNRLAVEAMLRKTGFSRIEYKTMWQTNIRQKLDPTAPPAAPGEILSGRMVFHVYP
jgi:tRNA (mo5U34)-methyltransferase